MLRRLALAAAVALSVSTAAPSDAAAPAKLYLNELTDACGNGTQNAITNSAEDSGACVIIPRLLVDGQGLSNTNESFASVKQVKTFRIDAKKKLTGEFALFGSSGLRAVPGPANLAADFTIKLGGTKVGVVRVEGLATPAGPVKKTWELTIPASLNRVVTNKAVVSVEWITCVGLCGVAVSGASYLTVPTR